MGFLGGGGNIAITTALPLSFCVFYCKHQIVHGISISCFFMLTWSFGFWMWRLTLAPRLPIPTVCRLLCSNVRGLAGNLSDLTVASSRYDIPLCSETCCQICVTCRSSFPDLVALSCAGAGCLYPEGRRHAYEINLEHLANPSLSVVLAKCCFLWFVVRDGTYMCSFFAATLT